MIVQTHDEDGQYAYWKQTDDEFGPNTVGALFYLLGAEKPHYPLPVCQSPDAIFAAYYAGAVISTIGDVFLRDQVDRNELIRLLRS